MDVYARLAASLDRLPNGFPPTPGGEGIALLEKIFSPEEAALAGRLTGRMTPVGELAARLGLEVREARSRLLRLARRGLAWFEDRQGTPHFRLAPFVVGIYEAQVDRLDPELARRFEAYMEAGGARGIMEVAPALHRVVPASGAVEPEWVLPYDDVRVILLNARTFHVRNCICRLEQRQAGAGCDFPLENCLSFSPVARAPQPGDLTREQALALLDEAERVGLVHTVSNIREGTGYVCNCCGCCCALLRAVRETGLEGAVARASYDAAVDPELCTGCGDCAERCQVEAVSVDGQTARVDAARCIGCGLCVTGCPAEAVRLRRRPDAEVVPPPADFAEWERLRLAARGLEE